MSEVKKLKTDDNVAARYLDEEETKRLYETLEERNNKLKEARKSANKWRDIRGYERFPSMKKQAYVDHLYPMVILSLHTGLRQGEVFSLTWADGNFYLRNLNTGVAKPWLTIRQWLGMLYEKDPAINIDTWTLEGSPAIGIGVKKPGRPKGTFCFLEDAGDVFLTYFGKDGQVYELTYQRDMGSVNALMICLVQ